MDGRSIVLSYIEDTLAAPDRVTGDPTDPTLTRSYKAIAAFGNRVLRVVHRRDGADIFVVTAHWDRGARR
jgi:cyanate lyase